MACISIRYFASGGLLKILIVEEIFQMGRPQLMTIPLFALVFNYVASWLVWLKQLPLYRAVADFARKALETIKHAIRYKSVL